MTQVTDHSPSLSSERQASPPRVPVVGEGVLGGAVAAVLGVGVLAVVVVLLWIGSPYPDSGPSGALHVAASLWLLAHGADLVRSDPLGGDPTPVGVTPILLTALPVWLLYRAARHTLEPPEDRPDTGERLPARPTIGWLSAGYLTVGLAVVVYTWNGPLRVDVLSTLLHLPVVTVAAASYGVWTAYGRPYGPLPADVRQVVERLPKGVRARITPPRVSVALRAAGAGTAVLLGGGALLVAVSLSWHAVPAQHAFQQAGHSLLGRFTVLVLAVALVPNAAVWGASYVLGPGFTVGAGSVVAPLGVTEHPRLPAFPLLAAVPGEGRGWPLTWSVGVVPVVMAGVVGWFVAAAAARRTPASAVPARSRARRPWRWRATAFTAVLASGVCGVTAAVVSWLASGPLGTGVLADFGPSWWQTGGAALAWTVVVAPPVALVMRGWWVWRAKRQAKATAAQGPGPSDRDAARALRRTRALTQRTRRGRRAEKDPASRARTRASGR